MKLVIISHTEHYKTADGTIVGWGPTVNEINHLTAVFDEIVHVAMLHHGEAPPSALPYTDTAISFVGLPAVGGVGIQAKWQVIQAVLRVIRVVSEQLKTADYFQLRTPTGIGVYLIPYLTYFSNTKGWYKYAGNWNQEQPPLGYRIQRKLLQLQSRPVTINGRWPQQPKHCLSFENPCLEDVDIEIGKAVAALKHLDGVINFCYVGRLESPKGVGRIIEALSGMDATLKSRIGTVHLVGDGAERMAFEQMAKNSDLSFIFHGFLARDAVFEIYKVCHGFLMPTTASEGFPKVLAEAMAFGCVPIVSNVSAIGHYISSGVHGFVMDTVDIPNIQSNIQCFMNLKASEYNNLKQHGLQLVQQFTFAYYNAHIKEAILDTV
ncbi:glycosyltransferase [Formosa sp. A9]|uniref:glycosyltransferase n=1 Tax=Formosa sp. A9 TaxID=3442641 RepID=UPI003EB70B81